MKPQIKHETDGTIEISLTIPWKDIAATYEIVVGDFVKEAEIQGFRKGKAPRAMVEPKLDKNHTYEEVIKRLVPKAYTDAVSEANIAPIVMPSIELASAKENEDWIVVAKTCEKPVVTLGDYKSPVHTLKNEKSSKIYLPGEAKTDEKDKKPTLDEILNVVVPTITISIPALLVEHEVNNQLAQLVDQTKKLGLTVEQYLASSQKTAESIREEYKAQVTRSLTLEFGMEAIADAEKITVTEDELAAVIKSAKTEQERKSFESQKYYVTSLLRRQKTLDFLAAL